MYRYEIKANLEKKLKKIAKKNNQKDNTNCRKSIYW